MSTIKNTELNFTLSLSALDKVTKILETEDKNNFFRIRIDGGGCAGFQYNFLIDNCFKENEDVVIQEQPKIITDDISLTFLNNCSLDYIQDMSGSKFIINNPNSSGSCGCGNSFSI